MLPDLGNPKSRKDPSKESVFEGHHFSEPAASNLALQRAFSGRDDLLASIPSIPAVLNSLLNELDQPAENVNLLRAAEIIGRDEALAAQCLRMANSALFSRGPALDSLRGAVRTLGIARIRDVAVSCGLMRILPLSQRGGLNPLVFWQHSLACAIVSRKLARSVGFGDPEKAYLAGLMHDIGYVVNMVVLPQQTKAMMARAQREGLFAGEVEYLDLGFTHCQSGEILARQWRLADTLVEVILCHHDPAAATRNPALVAIVSLADRLCRASDLGLGYAETPGPLESCAAEWRFLTEHCPFADEISWDDFVKESAKYVGEIHNLVTAMYAGGLS
ncbi:MAG: HDOD domain-containing protein [Candidatus Sulfotelmatobacter sp.]